MANQDSMDSAACEAVSYGASTYVWCRGTSPEDGPHPIFVSSPVMFMHGPGGRFAMLKCHHEDCSACGKPSRYEEQELRFQDGYVPRVEKRP